MGAAVEPGGRLTGLLDEPRVENAFAPGVAFDDFEGGGEAFLEAGGAVGGAGGTSERDARGEADGQCSQEPGRQEDERRRRAGKSRREEAGDEDPCERQGQAGAAGGNGPGEARLDRADQEQPPANTFQDGDERALGFPSDYTAEAAETSPATPAFAEASAGRPAAASTGARPINTGGVGGRTGCRVRRGTWRRCGGRRPGPQPGAA